MSICGNRYTQHPHIHKLTREKGNFFAGVQTRSCPSVEEPVITPEDFSHLKEEDKLLILLGKQIGCPKTERHIDAYVKRFLQQAWKLRRPHVVDTNKKYERQDYLVTF